MGQMFDDCVKKKLDKWFSDTSVNEEELTLPTEIAKGQCEGPAADINTLNDRMSRLADTARTWPALPNPNAGNLNIRINNAKTDGISPSEGRQLGDDLKKFAKGLNSQIITGMSQIIERHTESEEKVENLIFGVGALGAGVGILGAGFLFTTTVAAAPWLLGAGVIVAVGSAITALIMETRISRRKEEQRQREMPTVTPEMISIKSPSH